MKGIKIITPIILILTIISSLQQKVNATNYTWTGSKDTVWDDVLNWSPNGIPGSNDTVTIVFPSSTRNPVLRGSVTVKKFTITSGTLNLYTDTLTITNESFFNGGNINNGLVKPQGLTAKYAGTTFGAKVKADVAANYFDGSTFNDSSSFTNTSTGEVFSQGGSKWYAATTLKKTASGGTWNIGSHDNSYFGSTLYVINTSSNPIQLSDTGSNSYKGNITVESTGSGGILFGSSKGGTSTLDSGKTISVGGGGFTSGTLLLRNFTQKQIGAISLTLGGTAVINMICDTFYAKLTVSAPSVLLKTNVFNDSCSFTHTSNYVSSHCDGGNTFNGYTNITTTGSYKIRMGTSLGERFAGDVEFNGYEGGDVAGIDIGYGGNIYFEGDVTCNGKFTFAELRYDTVVFAGGNGQQVSSDDELVSIKRVRINKSENDVTLNIPMYIGTELMLDKGRIYSDTVNFLHIEDDGVATGASDSSFVAGPVVKRGDDAFVFPIGKNDFYRAMEISAPASGTDEFIAEYFDEGQELGLEKASTIDYMSSCNYWKLEELTGSSTPTINLYWGEYGCGIFNITDLRIISWDETEWIDLGNAQIEGDSAYGKIQNETSIGSYHYFTLGYYTPGIITIKPTLLGIGREIPPDLFGYNGTNTIQTGQTWEDQNSNIPPILSEKNVSTLRYPGGTVANYWDWRNGWFIPEWNLPFGIEYDNGLYAAPNPNPTGGGNRMGNFRDACDLVTSTPIFVWNTLTSGFYYQLASLYSAHELNLPVEYVELGNEYYLNEESYKAVYPVVTDYANRVNTWCSELKAIPPFTDLKVCAIGSQSKANDPGRRREWLKGMLGHLDPSANLDALSIHHYMGSGLGVNNSLSYGTIGQMLETPFEQVDLLIAEELDLIDFKNSYFTTPLEVWLTEYNMSDGENKGHKCVGTWPHGLFEAIQTLKYLESPLVTKILSHTMTSDAVFGNIFESDHGFSEINLSDMPVMTNSATITEEGEFTAIGCALNQIAIASRNADWAIPIDFNGLGVDPVRSGSPYLSLYGWSFDRHDGAALIGQQIVIVNAGPKSYDLDYSSILNNGVLSALYEQIKATHLTTGIAGSPIPPGPIGLIHYLVTTGEQPAGATIKLEPFSMTRIFFSSPDVSLRINDNEICGSTASYASTTALEGIGGVPPYSYSCSGGSISGNIFTAPTGLTSTTTYTITVMDDVNTTASATITVHPPITDFSASATDDNICWGEEVELSAALFTPGAGGSNSHNYSYIWTPDSGIVNLTGTCAAANPDLSPMRRCIMVKPDRTTTYQLYITDGQCWSHSDPITINVGGAGANVVANHAVCTGAEDGILTVVSTNPDYTGNTHYEWSFGVIDAPINYDLGAGTYTVTVTQTSLGLTCTATYCATISEISCCSASASCDVVVNPGSNFNDLKSAVQTAGISCYTYTPATKTITQTGTGLILLNGDVLVNDSYTLINCTISLGEDAKLTVKKGKTLTLINCTLEACSTQMWNSIYCSGTGTGIIIDNCAISDALTAVDVSEDAVYSITDNNFSDNYRSIYIHDYYKAIKTENPDYLITNNDFTTTTGLLIEPYSGQNSSYGIFIDDVVDVQIGKYNQGYNIFSNLNTGIYSSQSSFQAYKNQFTDILVYNPPALRAPWVGCAIYNTSAYDYHDRTVEIGRTTASNWGNGFTDCQNGILLIGETNASTQNNTFTHSTAQGTDLRVLNNYSKTIDITGNHFGTSGTAGNFNIGMYLYNVGLIGKDNIFPAASVNIAANEFYTAALPSPLSSFSGSAIVVHNPIGLSHDVTIIDNYIEDARIGIHALNVSGIKIGGENNATLANDINFNLGSSALSNYHAGIWLQNCYQAHVATNEIDNDAFNADPLLRGIDVETSLDCDLNCNTIDNMGYAINFNGDCDLTKLRRNEMTYYGIGVNLQGGNGAKINIDQGIAGGSGAWDNTWTPHASSTYDVGGLYTGGGQINWYHQSLNNPSPSYVYSPNPWQGNLINPIENQSSGNVDCNDYSRMAGNREANFGPVVGDSASYSEDGDASRYLARMNAYRLMKHDTTIIYRDEPLDSDFEDFFTAVDTTNAGKFQRVLELAADYPDSAAAINASITDTNTIETNLKTFYSIYFDKIANGVDLDGADSAALEDIAAQPRASGGEAVHNAAAALFMEIHPTVSAPRLMQPAETANTKASESGFAVFPNPANDLFIIKMNSEDVLITSLKVYNSLGKLVTAKQCYANFTQVDVKHFAEGLYSLLVTYNNKTELKTISVIK